MDQIEEKYYYVAVELNLLDINIIILFQHIYTICQNTNMNFFIISQKNGLYTLILCTLKRKFN